MMIDVDDDEIIDINVIKIKKFNVFNEMND